MSIQDQNPNNPLGSEKLKGLKEQAISGAENQIAGKVSEELNNPVASKIIENRNTIRKTVRDLSSDDVDLSEKYTPTWTTNDPVEMAKYLSKKTFKDYLAEKDSVLVYCTLTMDGKDFLPKNSCKVELRQHTNDHDTFTITVPDDALDSFEGYVMENSKNLLGKNVTVNYHKSGEIRQSFTGIIANIKNKKDDGGGYGNLLITGYAPSILLENGKDCQSFENKNLKDIINDALKEYKSEVPILTDNLNTKYTIPYTVQYKESDYQFIKRLAQRYGEYLYYNGQSLVFGNKVQPIVKLEENKDLIDIELEMMIKPQSFSYMAYDSTTAEVKEKDSDSVMVQYKENPFQAIAVNASKRVFGKKAEMLFNATSQQNVDNDLKEMVIRQRESREHLMQVKGRSRDPQLRIGGRAQISDINGKAMETYRIIDIFHFHDGDLYYNEFTGIPDIFISPFFDEDAFPSCEEQSAIVTDNDHPQGMIRVQFPWQRKKGLKTPWLRVVTPYAGKGKGMHIIPEVGEEVVVGFDNGNAERPFVFGAMFNGKASAGVGAGGNHVKRIQSASGSGMEFHDKHGHSRIWDAVGDEVKLDGAGNLSAVANSTGTIDVAKGTSIISMAENSLFAGANDTIILQVGENSLQISSGGNIKLNATSNFSITVGASTFEMDMSGNILINGKNIGINASGGNAVITGDEVDIN